MSAETEALILVCWNCKKQYYPIEQDTGLYEDVEPCTYCGAKGVLGHKIHETLKVKPDT